MKKNNEKNIPQIIINEAASEKRNPVLNGVIIKFVISCLISVGTLFSLISIYELPVNLGVCFFITIAFQLIFFTAFSCTRKLFVFAATGFIAVAAAFLLNTSFLYSAMYFKDSLLMSLDSRLLHTLNLLSFKTWKLTSANVSYVRGVLIIFIFVIAAVSMISVLCTYKKPHCLSVLAMFTVLFSASFIAEICEFRISMLPFFMGVFMLIVISSSYTTEKLLACIRSTGVRVADKEFEKRNSKRKLYKMLKHRMLRYGKFKTNAIWGGALALLSLCIGMWIFNDNGYIDYTEVYQNIANAGESIKNFVNGMGFGSDTAFEEYFSTAYKGKRNSSLSITSPGTGERDVLVVTVDNPDDAVFLRGDIGVNYNGASWSTLPENETRGYGKLFNDYIPETEMKTFFNILSLTGLDVSKYMKLQNIQLDYLQNTDVVMLPTSPYEYSYRNNKSFKVTGDTIIRTTENFIETVECSVVYPIISADMATALEWADELVGLWDMDVLSSIALSGDVSQEKLENYKEYREEYKTYVYDTYMNVPSDLKKPLDEYIKDKFGSSANYFANATMTERFNSSFALCEYLKSNYKYSLDFKTSEKDSIMTFLNETKSGHCALYASSMVLILREVGIPARYCTGFVADGNGSYTNGTYKITLKEKNLHAWVEVYFDEFGWLPFDPTGSGDGNANTNPLTTTPAVTTSRPPSTPNRSTSTTPKTTSSHGSDVQPQIVDITLIFLIASAVLFSLLIISSVLFVISTQRKAEALFRHFKNDKPTKSIKQMYGFILDLLVFCGLQQENGETLENFAARIDKFSVSEKRFVRFVPLFEAVEFGGEDVSEPQRTEVYAYTEALYNEIIGKRFIFKRIYMIYRLLK